MTTKRPYPDPLDSFQERMMATWSSESDLSDAEFDSESWPDVWPTLMPEQINQTPMPLVLLSLEESDHLWFKLGEMSPNLWQWRTSALKRLTANILYYQPLGVRGRMFSKVGRTLQTCTMTKQIASHTVRVECSLAYTGIGTIGFGMMSQIFVDDVLAGEAIATATRSNIGGGIHSSSPAYIRIGGLLLQVFAPWIQKDHHINPGQPWVLDPPHIEIWLRTTKGKLAGVPVSHHHYDSFAPSQNGNYGRGFNTLSWGRDEPRPSKNSQVLQGQHDWYKSVRDAIEEMKWVQRNFGGTDDRHGHPQGEKDGSVSGLAEIQSQRPKIRTAVSDHARFDKASSDEDNSMAEIIYPPSSIGRKPVLIHVPHSSTHVPEEYRGQLRLDDESLNAELLVMTDWFTDQLFGQALKYGATLFLNRVSRLVMDPERFPDDQDEPMSAKGMGAIYTRTSGGVRLRTESFSNGDRQEVMDKLYWPYSDTFRNLVKEQLDRFGGCLIIDGHSFSSKALPYEDKKLVRPDLCFGYDPFHEPNILLDTFETCSSLSGLKTARNQPFSGSYVPTDFFLKERRVKSIMIEINRSLYFDEATSTKSTHYDKLSVFLNGLLGIACH